MYNKGDNKIHGGVNMNLKDKIRIVEGFPKEGISFKDVTTLLQDGEALKEAISKRIKEKSDNLVGDMASQGTTPRQLTDLIGSLCDLTSGSGDKGTPVVLVQGYFDNYTN